MRNIMLQILFLCIVTSTGLIAQERDDAYFKQVAIDICDCTTEMDKYTKELQELYSGGEATADQKAVAAKLEKASIDFNNCIEGLKKKYPDIENNKSYESRAEKALNDHCSFFAAGNDNNETQISVEDEVPVAEITKDEVEEAEIMIEDVTPINTEYQKFATEACDCMSEETALMQEFEALKAKGNEHELAIFRRSINENYPSVLNCFKKIAKNHKDIDAYDNSRTKRIAALKEYCPSYLDLMGFKN